MTGIMAAMSINLGYAVNVRSVIIVTGSLRRTSANPWFCLQPYNWKVPCAVEPLCYSFDQVTQLLNVRCLLSCLLVDC